MSTKKVKKVTKAGKKEKKAPILPVIEKEGYVDGQQIMLTGKQVIFDAIFNYGRTIKPRLDDNETPHTLDATLAPGSALGMIVYPPEVREALPEEKEQWFENHKEDNWVEGDESKIPNLIVADGFGRWESWVVVKGLEEPLACVYKEIGKDDGVFRSLVLQSATRKRHPLDVARILSERKKVKGIKKNSDLAEQVGFSQVMIGKYLKCLKLTEKDHLKAIADNWSLNQIISRVEGYSGSPETPPKGSRKVSSKVVDRLIDFGIPEIRDHEDDYGLDAEVSQQFLLVSVVLEYVQGRYSSEGGAQDLLAALKGNGFFSDVDFGDSIENLAKVKEKEAKK